MTKAAVRKKWDKFLDTHFGKTVANMPNWRQHPNLQDLYEIYMEAKASGLSYEDLSGYVRNDWMAKQKPQPRAAHAEQLGEFCETLCAWDMYERCASQA